MDGPERKPLEQRIQALDTEQSNHLSTWRDLVTYIRPTRGFFTGDDPSRPKAIDNSKMIDGTPARASRTQASGMASGISSPSRPWFKLGLDDHDLMKFDPVKEFLAVLLREMMALFQGSNIYGMLHSVYTEVGFSGTACSAALADPISGLRGRCWTIGEYMLGVGPDGRVNTFARKYKETVGQVVTEFGKENVCEATMRLWRAGAVDKYIDIWHLCEPNDSRIPGKADFKNMAIRSAYWEPGTPRDTYLALRGVEEFPFFGVRWDVRTQTDPYGLGLGHDCLGDCKMLQAMQTDKLIGLKKTVDPPLQADGSVDEDVVSLPGGLTRSSAQTPNMGVRPAYEVQLNFADLGAEIGNVQRAINETFYKDLFLMLYQTEATAMTAREVVERHEEKLLMLGPVLERLQTELLDRLISRTFAIMLRNGQVPPIPQELEGRTIKVEYVSILAQAQKMVGTTAIKEQLALAGSVAVLKPEVWDTINLDKAFQGHGEMIGLDTGIMRSDADIAAIREARNQAAQAEAQMQQAERMAAGAKTLSEAQVGEGNALEAVAGVKPGGPAK